MIESEKQGVSDKIIEEVLNEIDNQIQEILMDGEKGLAPLRVDCFTRKLKKYKKERKYWRRLRKGEKLTHLILKKCGVDTGKKIGISLIGT